MVRTLLYAPALTALAKWIYADTVPPATNKSKKAIRPGELTEFPCAEYDADLILRRTSEGRSGRTAADDALPIAGKNAE